MGQNKEGKNWVTKEVFIFIVPFVAAYLCAVIYEAGYATYFHIPYGFIEISINSIFLTTRLVLMVATIAFLWIGLYYKILPSASSPIFQGLVTFILILALILAFQFGAAEASKNTEYLVLHQKDGGEAAVLRVYGDTLIAAPFNRATRQMHLDFHILNKKDLGNYTFSSEIVGPLVVTH